MGSLDFLCVYSRCRKRWPFSYYIWLIRLLLEKFEVESMHDFRSKFQRTVGGRPAPLSTYPSAQMSTIIRRYMTDTNVGPNYMDDQNYLSAPLISV